MKATLKEKMHMIPQPIQDIAQNLLEAKQEHVQDLYLARMEAIRDFTNATIDQFLKKNSKFKKWEKN